MDSQDSHAGQGRARPSKPHQPRRDALPSPLLPATASHPAAVRGWPPCTRSHRLPFSPNSHTLPLGIVLGPFQHTSVQSDSGLTLMRPPVVKRQKYPASGFLLSFRLLDSSIVGNRQRVLTSWHMQVPQRGCTTHFLRFSRHVHDECRNQDAYFLRPRNISVPSYRPRQR